MFPAGELIFCAAESSVDTVSEGGFAKNILVLSLSEPEQNQAFLRKVLSAANLDLATDTRFAEIPLGQALNCFSGLDARPKFILAFGLPPKQLGCQALVKLYEPLELQQCTWLFADPLSILEPNRDKKGQLWTALKALFL